ncbi:MAG: MTH1187 family thiamine-binding protein [Hydrogenothermaceae bacterium]|nr:MTH1187 family thiamine-binding protein [Hydrogenothermaceae bacterium]
MSFLVEFSMFPTDKGESVSPYVSRIIDMIDRSGVPYRLTPMGTVFEVESMEEALDIINRAYNQLEPDCSRVYTTIKMDIRKGKSGRIESKIKSVKEKLGRKVNE